MSAMTISKYKPGDRVVWTSIRAHNRAIGGTVIRVEERPHHSGVWSGINFFLYVILDNAEKICEPHAHFYLESEYDPRIPF